MNYLEVVGVSYNELETITRGELWKRIRDYDNREWLSELDRLTDRDVYKANRKSVGDSWGYDNSEESDLLFRARSNTLKVNSWNRHLGGITSCGLCDATLETLEHFLLHCPGVGNKRRDDLILEVGGTGNDKEIIGKILFNKNKIQEVKRMIGNMWRERLSRLERAERLALPTNYNLRDRSLRRRWLGRWGEVQ